ncbi:MAG: hypothetical protein H6907_05560 [Hyphomicrobiales bacterium]|nr:hypothetical protein [Hyphomicrobiales bacterium]MCP5371183.1 hypothetical protein [Hyphomicrobiales bacterium]
MNGVFNGCELIHIAEKTEAEALDCVHEMDAINHFVGMYPIASGGVLEKAFSQFLFAMLGVLLVGFMLGGPRARAAFIGAGFLAIAGWMAMAFYGPGGIKYQNEGYVSALVTSLGQGQEEEGEELSPIIAQLKESLGRSGQTAVSQEELKQRLEATGQGRLQGVLSKLREGAGGGGQAKSLKEILAEAKESGASGKAVNIRVLQQAFEADQARAPADRRQAWTGSGNQVLFWHYAKSLGRWFNIEAKIKPLVRTMSVAGTVVFWGILALMVVLTFAASRRGGLLYWLIPLVPIVVPVAFIVEYASWLWWYGHSLSEMGAFTLKPFMPTVFGQGKVAQFSTFSYPHYGFGLLVLAALLTGLSALIRRKQMREAGAQAG